MCYVLCPKVAVAVALFVARSRFCSSHYAPYQATPPPFDSLFNLGQSGAIKGKNAKHIRSKCTLPRCTRFHLENFQLASCHIHGNAAADATHVAWPCHLLNEMSSKLAVNLFAIFLLLFHWCCSLLFHLLLLLLFLVAAFWNATAIAVVVVVAVSVSVLHCKLVWRTLAK